MKELTIRWFLKYTSPLSSFHMLKSTNQPDFSVLSGVHEPGLANHSGDSSLSQK